jgi:hypothetical protein
VVRRQANGILIAFFAVSALSACHRDPLGIPCKDNDTCGPGYGCTYGACVQLCTNDGECRKGYNCVRYHCVKPQEAAPTPAGAPVGVVPMPPRPPMASMPPGAMEPPGSRGATGFAPTAAAMPDSTAIELRALRRELELIRHDQQKILDLLDKKK